MCFSSAIRHASDLTNALFNGNRNYELSKPTVNDQGQLSDKIMSLHNAMTL